MAKKIEKIHFYDNGTSLEIPVYFEKSNGYGEETGFFVTLPELGIHKIKKPSFQELEIEVKNQLIVQTSIQWKKVLHIQADYSPRMARENGWFEVEFNFKANEREIGENSKGESFNREPAARANRGKLPSGSNVGRDNGGRPIFTLIQPLKIQLKTAPRLPEFMRVSRKFSSVSANFSRRKRFKQRLSLPPPVCL